MRTYIEFMKNSFQMNITYRFNTFLKLIVELISVFIQIMIWTALFKNNVTTTNLGNISLSEMITYTIVSTCVSIVISNNVIVLIDGKIKTGEIAMDLIKPINFGAYLFSITLGENLFNILFKLIPILIIIIPIFGMNFSSFLNTIFFIILLFNGILIYFLSAFILGLIGFWYMSIWHLERFLYDFIRLFAGSLIPLWFFPEILLKISSVLPFRLIYYIPISTFIGKLSLTQITESLFQQFVWLITLAFIVKLVWNKGTSKLVIQGG